MASELYNVIDALSREKGINPDIVVSAVEDAIVVATRKFYKTQESLRAVLDRESGAIRAYSVKEILPSEDDIEDPQTQISLIWYGHKGGLEDRVFRIRTGRSSATSMPEPRTSHNISNVEILRQGGGVCELRFNWVTFSYRYKTVGTYFGTSFYTLDVSGDRPLIKKKKVILKNDYIHHVVDIYHV